MLFGFRDGNRLVLYIIGWIIFVVSVVESFIGYILVWGNMSYWGASVIINILAIIPFIGSTLVNFIWCSSSVVLNFAITIHFLVGLIIIALIILHILYLHNISSSSPFINSSSSLIIPFFPIFFKDLFAIILLFLFCSLNFFFEVESIYGNVENLVTASAQTTPHHILPEWYFLLFYSILRAFPAKVIGAIIVLIFFSFILFRSKISRFIRGYTSPTPPRPGLGRTPTRRERPTPSSPTPSSPTPTSPSPTLPIKPASVQAGAPTSPIKPASVQAGAPTPSPKPLYIHITDQSYRSQISPMVGAGPAPRPADTSIYTHIVNNGAVIWGVDRTNNTFWAVASSSELLRDPEYLASVSKYSHFTKIPMSINKAILLLHRANRASYEIGKADANKIAKFLKGSGGDQK